MSVNQRVYDDHLNRRPNPERFCDCGEEKPLDADVCKLCKSKHKKLLWRLLRGQTGGGDE